MICFEHIPKTAGKSLNLTFQSIYKDKYLNVKKHGIYPSSTFNDVQFVSGHRCIETLAMNNLVPDDVVTFLRRPNALLKSNYAHLLRSFTNITNLKARIFLKGPRHLLEEHGYILFDNGTIRRIINYNGPVGSVNEGHLEACIEALDDFSFVGLQEDYLKSVYLMSKVLGWQKLPIICRFNDLPKTKTVMSAFAADESYLDDLNRWDSKLYAHFQKSFSGHEVCSEFDVWKKIAVFDHNTLNLVNKAFSSNKRKTRFRKILGR